MKPFTLEKYAKVEDAINALSADASNSAVYAGGTDLLVRQKNRLYTAPDALVDIKGIDALRFIRQDSQQGMEIGSLITLGELSESPQIHNYPSLLQTIVHISSPELRNQSTVGGNLLQQVWCPYYRSNYKCWRNGGETCYAEAGDNTEYQSIMGARKSYAAYPGDLAVTLTALDAKAVIIGSEGERTVTMEELIPGEVEMNGRIQSHILKNNEILKGIIVPPPQRGSVTMFRKVRRREVWDFATASLALNVILTNGEVSSCRAVFGGIATRPWRDLHLEEYLIGKKIGESLPGSAIQQALLDSKPLPYNGYKKDQAAGLLYAMLSDLEGLP